MDSIDNKFDAIFDALYDQVAIIDRNFRIIKANRAYEESYGLSPKQNSTPLCYETLNNLSVPCHEKGKPCPIIQVFETKAPVSMEQVIKNAKGSPVDVELKALPILDSEGNVESAAVILRDITHWKHTENKLFESVLKFRQIAEMGPDAVFILNSNFQIEFANSRASELIGLTTRELANLDFRMFLDDKGIDFLSNLGDEFPAESDRQISKELKLYNERKLALNSKVYIGSCGSKEKEQKFFVYIRDLSEQQLMEEKLRQASEFLSNLIESSVDGIIASDMRGTVIIFNKGAENLLGYKAEEVIGKFKVVNFYPPGVAQDIMRKLRSDDYGGKGKVLPMQFVGIHKNGEHIPVNLSGALVYQNGKEVASVGIFYDLREILKAEKDLLESEIRFRNLFERVRHGIYFSSREGKFIDCNSAMLEILGYEKKEDFLSMEIARDLYFNPDHRAVFQEMIERHGSVKDYEVNYKKKNGEPVTVQLTAHVRKDQSGKVQGYQGIVIDVTERRKLEQKLFQTEKLAAMGRLTAQIAHELNNPIYGVMNCLDLLKSEVSEENKKRKFLDMAYSETKRISQLLRSMLKFYRPDEDVKTMIDINQIVNEVVLFIGKQLQEFKIRVKLELDDKLPEIFASGNQLKQVLLNMIMNARAAMPRGGTLTFATLREGEDVRLEIKDTGVGIPPENRDHIFEAFFTTKSDVKGVGLGLSVCFGIIHEHGGRIELESEVGKGTTFIIILPIGA